MNSMMEFRNFAAAEELQKKNALMARKGACNLTVRKKLSRILVLNDGYVPRERVAQRGPDNGSLERRSRVRALKG